MSEPFTDPKLITNESARIAAHALFVLMSEKDRVEFPYSDYDKSCPIMQSLAERCYNHGNKQ